MKCPECGGVGRIHYGEEWCSACNGTGEIVTNEEWLRQATTEQLAEWIAHQTMIALLENQNNHSLLMTYSAYWVEWLKKPHKE